MSKKEMVSKATKPNVTRAAKQKVGKQMGIGCLIVLILILGGLWFSGFFNSRGQKTSFSKALPQKPGSASSSPEKKTGKLLEIVVWPGTEKKPLRERTEIWIEGHGSWFPNLEYGADKHSFGYYEVGEVNEFFFYPDGRNGTEIKVQFKMTAEMISGSDAAKIWVSIFDDEVEVVGQAIEGRSATFKR